MTDVLMQLTHIQPDYRGRQTPTMKKVKVSWKENEGEVAHEKRHKDTDNFLSR
jgi:hypothetical protein